MTLRPIPFPDMSKGIRKPGEDDVSTFRPGTITDDEEPAPVAEEVLIAARKVVCEVYADFHTGRYLKATLDGYHDNDLEVELAVKAILAERKRCAAIAYNMPAYCIGGLKADGDGTLLPGSPYDRGRYEARRDILGLPNSTDIREQASDHLRSTANEEERG